jgi:hypothetical protein
MHTCLRFETLNQMRAPWNYGDKQSPHLARLLRNTYVIAVLLLKSRQHLDLYLTSIICLV